MSGEQWGEAVNAAALAISVYDWNNGLSSNPEIGKHQRAEAEAAIAAATELIVADTRRKVAEEIEAEQETDPDPFGGHDSGWDSGWIAAIDRAAAIARGKPNLGNDVIAFVEDHGHTLTDWQKDILRADVAGQAAAIARGSGNGDSGQEGT